MTHRSFVAALTMAVAAILSQATSVQAGGIIGTMPLAGFTVTENGTDLSNSTTITASSVATTGPGAGDYSGVPVLTSFSGPIVLDLKKLTLSTMSNATYGSFSASTVTIVSQSASFLDVYVVGTYTPGSGLAAGLSPTPSSLNIAITQAGASISEALTLSSPVLSIGAVPEPPSVIMGLASVVGCGLFFGLRRRSGNGSA
jgi:hypothetical protein